MKVTQYRFLITGVRANLTSCKSVANPGEREREAQHLRRSVAELRAANCPRLTARDVETATAWVNEAQAWLATYGYAN